MSNVTASIEHATSIVRVGPDHRSPYDPYTWCCTVRWRDPETVEILGVVRAPTPSEFRAAKRLLQSLGAKRHIHERVRPDGTVERHSHHPREI
jgi:hypothetical protein